MAEEIAVKVIARIHTDFPEKFGIPRQSGLIEELKSTIVFEPEFRDANALRGIEEYSHLWLIWEFSEAVRDTWSPMVRPPRLPPLSCAPTGLKYRSRITRHSLSAVDRSVSTCSIMYFVRP